MRKREQYEDIIHDIVSAMLPKMAKSKIRPSYQVNGGYAGDNAIYKQYTDGISGFSRKDDFIYFKVVLDDEFDGAFIAEDGSITVNRKFSVVFNVYGANSNAYALMIVSLLRAPYIQQLMNVNGIFLLTTNNVRINQFNEVINSEVWERRDFTISFNEDTTIKVPEKPIIAEDGDIIEVRP